MGDLCGTLNAKAKGKTPTEILEKTNPKKKVTEKLRAPVKETLTYTVETVKWGML